MSSRNAHFGNKKIAWTQMATEHGDVHTSEWGMAPCWLLWLRSSDRWPSFYSSSLHAKYSVPVCSGEFRVVPISTMGSWPHIWHGNSQAWGERPEVVPPADLKSFIILNYTFTPKPGWRMGAGKGGGRRSSGRRDFLITNRSIWDSGLKFTLRLLWRYHDHA